MAPKIRRLSDVVINQIAAGEVIENPASVVKELVDNALDAGARLIKVEILGGGLQMVRISDDGCGMGLDDALLCLERHATSKIEEASDLFAIQTMGFRGEAIASIASISKMTLTTSLEEIGVQLEVEAGRVISTSPSARNRGTTVEVRHLFYNTPARRKFQKSPAGCMTEVSRILSTLSLGYPHVAFELYNHGELTMRLDAMAEESYAEAIKARARDILSESFVKDTVSIDDREGSFHIEGLLGLPSNTRHNRLGGYLFVNGRPVTSPALSFAIRDGFGTRIAADRHPVYVLSVTMPMDLIDVNVHPQKKEVRLSDEVSMKRLVQRAVSKALDAPQHFAKEDVAFAPVFSDFSFETVHNAPVEAASAPVYYQAYVASGEQQASFSFDEVQVVGIWGRKVIVDALSFSESSPIKMEAGLCIIDLEAARARITFENLLKSKDERIPGQALLFSISVQMSAVEIDALMQSQDILINMGYSFTQTSPRSILIDALPSSCTEGDAKDVLFEMAASCISLDRDEGEGLEGKKRRELAKIACRHQQGGDSAVTKAEALSIIKALMKTQAPYFCPEGKKTIAYVSEKDIEKYFFAAP